MFDPTGFTLDSVSAAAGPSARSLTVASAPVSFSSSSGHFAFCCKVLDAHAEAAHPGPVHAQPRGPAPLPPSLPDRAAADLRFIRGAMERSGSFTALPGRGGMAMGALAVAAAGSARWVVSQGGGPNAWLAVWIVTAVVAGAVGLVTMQHKAEREGASLLRGPGRRFLFCLGPSLAAGALLTAGLARVGQHELLPPAWLLLYGAGVVAAGAFSIRVVPAVGAAFLALGAFSLAAPPGWGDALMAVGFGGIHLVSGFVIARRHGG